MAPDRDIERRVIGDALWWSYVSDDGFAETRWVRHEITRVTARRVYYMDRDRETYCDRASLEATGRAFRRGGLSLYLDGPEEHAHREAQRDAETVRRLRQEAAEAHPDRGGSSAAFIAANNRYQRAKAATRRKEQQ